jgi:VWFA-related protein
MAGRAGSRIGTFTLLLLLFPCSFLQSQSKKSRDIPDKSQPTFRTAVNVVVINATVLDKQGNPVADLAQSDFKIYEDGKPQVIQTFELESYEPIQSKETATAEGAPRHTAAVTRRTPTRPRMISLLIDDMTSPAHDKYPLIIQAVTKFIEQDVVPGDQVAILSGSGRVRYPFSDDKQTLLEEIAAVSGKLIVDGVTKSECPTLAAVQAKKIAERYLEDIAKPSTAQDSYFDVAVEETLQCMSLDKTNPNQLMMAKSYARAAASRQAQESEYRSRALLGTFRRHIRSLGHFDAVKSAVIFSNGFLSEGGSLISYELQDVVDQALASGVVLNTVDIRGLYTAVMPASEGSTTSSNLTQYKQTMHLEDMAAQEAPLFQTANDTGGLFYHNSNDMYDGLKKTVQRHSSYYLLTYAKPSQKYDGRYHQIKVEVGRPGLELSYRKGYYAPKEELTFERRKKEDILEALKAPGNLNEIPIELAYNYYQRNDSTYAVSLMTTVSIRGLHFVDEDSRRRNLINLVVAAFDEVDHFVEGIEKSIDFKLTDATYVGLLDHGFLSKVEFKLPLGRYKIKAVVREAAQGKMGSVTQVIEIP